MDEVLEELMKAAFEMGLNRGAKRRMPSIVVDVQWDQVKALFAERTAIEKIKVVPR